MKLNLRISRKIDPPALERCHNEDGACGEYNTLLPGTCCLGLEIESWTVSSAHRPQSCIDATVKPRKKAEDPLAKYPALVAFWPQLRKMSTKALPGFKFNEKGRAVVAALVKTDGFSEREVIDTLTWWLTEFSEQAANWRKYCKSIMSLRKDIGNGTKFAQMNAIRLEDKAAPAAKGPTSQAVVKGRPKSKMPL